MQNWNDGKAHEFKDRRTYNIGRSVLTHAGVLHPDAAAPEAETADLPVRLFATATCPNCKIAAKLLDEAGIPYEKLLVEENRALAESLGLKQAPTLVCGDAKFAGVAGVKDFIAQKEAKVHA